MNFSVLIFHGRIFTTKPLLLIYSQNIWDAYRDIASDDAAYVDFRCRPI